MTTPGFELQNVTKCYGPVVALSGVSLDLPAVRHTAVFGPSGGGKSTLLRLLAGLEPPTAGTIRLSGQPASAPQRILLPPHERGVAMVFQDLALWPNLTVRENVRLGLSGLRANRREIDARIREALELCAISPLAERRPAQLSGGQQQRAALARALAVQPRFLLLDEPFSGVDLPTKATILADIARLAEGGRFTVLLASHDPWEALDLCPDAVVVDSGVVRAAGPLRDLLASSPQEPFCSFRRLRVARDPWAVAPPPVGRDALGAGLPTSPKPPTAGLPDS